MAEEAKAIRRTAKAKFTRKRNEFLKSVDADQGREMVEGNYLKLSEAWDIVEGKHDLYTMYLTDEELEVAEKWITELQDLFAEATSLKIQYINNSVKAENDARGDLLRHESEMRERAEIERKTEKAILMRAKSQTVFEAISNNTKQFLESDTITSITLERSLKQLEEAHAECKRANDEVLNLADHETAESAIKFAAYTQCQLDEMIKTITSRIELVDQKATKRETCAPSSLQLEKIKLPRFEGEIRAYPQFKRDFEKQIRPHLQNNDAAYVLRSCLGNDPMSTVKSIDDDIDEIWKRLDEKYGDPAKVADVIIDAIRKTRIIKEGEEKRFVEFVDVVEDGYRDLKRLGLEAEITTTSSVSIIERKLPTDIRRKWAEIVSTDNSTVDKTNKFPALLKFLRSQRGAIEYDTASLRAPQGMTKAAIHYTAAKEDVQNTGQRITQQKCLIHENGKHSTGECKVYLSKSLEEKKTLLKDKNACWSCLKIGHRARTCRGKNTCGVNECSLSHHPSLHEDKLTPSTPSATGPTNVCSETEFDTCLLQVQKIQTKKGTVNVMWDNAASLCFITNAKAKEQKLNGKKVDLTIIKIGAQNEKMKTMKYTVPLIDAQGKTVQIEAYGIDKITSDIESVDIDGLKNLFKDVSHDKITRPSGPVDILIGYEYAAYHPERKQSAGHLLLLRNRFGLCIGGTHPSMKNAIKKHDLSHARVQHVIKVEDFYKIENLGVECNPRCGNCKCGHCAIGSKNYSIKEEKELQLVEKNMKFDAQDNRWIAEYPWIKDPNDLPDNRRVALAMLASTERRLQRNPQHATVYDEQVKDMVQRGVARKLTNEELTNYKGPIHYISHHEVLKPDSKSTPVRIVFNSSANYMGHVLNEYWAKGPDLLNSLLGILVRFRENEVAFIGDIKKMYHTVKITELDQHTHRFLWRDMVTHRPPDTYVIQRVSFGDKPSATIATMALRKTADMGNHQYPDAAKIVQNNTYMDDIIESTKDFTTAQKLTSDIETLISKGGFKLKEWIFSNDTNNHEKPIPNEPNVATEKVLGVQWDPIKDQLFFSAKLDSFPKRKRGKKKPKLINNSGITTQLTKRIILSRVNSMYDPLGLAGPFTVRAKILMRRLWANNEKLDWDDPIPEENKQHWLTFFEELPDMNQVRFERCIKPSNAVGNPILIIFCDASEDAFGSCAYVRWKTQGGGFVSNLIISKNRLAPIKKMSIDKLELCGAVLSKRLKSFIDKECRYTFEKCYYIVDSQIVHAMIQKHSYGFNTFAATRIGEIQEGTNIEDWYWCESELNIADWLTRGKKPNEIGLYCAWQEGPPFLKKPEDEWPISRNYSETKIPREIMKSVNTVIATVTDTLASRINIERHSDYKRLLRVTARILNFYKRETKLTFKNALQEPTAEDVKRAETFWIKEAQRSMERDIKDGKYKRLCPRLRDDGIYVISGRAEKWLEIGYNKEDIILLPYHHRFARLYCEYIHRKGHHGVLTTASKIRSRFWITKLLKMAKSTKLNCVTCKRLDKKLSEQVMGNLPEERLKPAPPWYSTSIDLFGPYTIRDEVKKRTTSKAYGVIFNCIGTRAVYLDLVPDYSTEKFLMALRRFVSLRGYPSKLYSDNGSQLVAANQELRNAMKSLEWDKLKSFGVLEGFEWNFTSADAPWQNGTSESLIRSVKRALKAAIGESILTFSELQTVFFEVANLLNERPIGRHPTSPEDSAYLCPNDLLLGRSTARVPSGPFGESKNPRLRFEFVQNIVNSFWKKWTTNYFPDLVVRQKWHTSHRNLKIGDVVLVQDSNLVRGQWRLARVSNTFPGTDGRVRKVEVQYKNPKPGEHVTKYGGRGYTTIERPVHRLVVLLPIDEKSDF